MPSEITESGGTTEFTPSSSKKVISHKEMKFTPEQFVEQALESVRKKDKDTMYGETDHIFAVHDIELKSHDFMQKVVDFVVSNKNDESNQLLSKLIIKTVKEGDSSYLHTVLNDYLKEKKGQVHLWRLVKLTTEFLSHYNLQNENIKNTVILEMAKLVVKLDKSGDSISTYVKSFGITDQDVLIELAKISAAHNGFQTSSNIKNFGIDSKTEKGQKGLIAIALISAAQDGGATSRYIDEYDIKDLNALVEIAKTAAAQDGFGTSSIIKAYGFKDQNILIAIAKIAAAHNGRGLSIFIEKYGITDLDALIEIAEISAAQNGESTSENIGNFKIDGSTEKGQKALIKIAKIALAQSAGASDYIDRYGIKDQDALIALSQISAAQDGWKTFQNINNFKIDETTEKGQMAIIEINKIAMAKNASLIKLIEGIAAIIAEEPEKRIKNELYDFLKYTIRLYDFRQITLSDFQVETLLTITKYHDPNMRKPLSLALHDLNPEQVETWKKITQGMSNDFINLPAILLSKLIQDDKKWKDLPDKMQSRMFKDYKAHRPLIDTLYWLAKASELSEDDIVTLLEGSIDTKNKDKSISNLRIIQGILTLNGAEELKKENFKKHKDLETLYQTIFQQTIPIQNIENFGEKMIKTFLSFRSNAALLVYAGKMNMHREKNQMMKILAEFVEAVLNNTFKKARDVGGGKHLETVFKDRDELKNAWMQGAEEPLSLDTITKLEDIKRDYHQIFKDAIVQFKHLDATKYPVIIDYIKASENNKNDIETTLFQQIETLGKKQKELAKTKDKIALKIGLGKIKELQLQMEIIKLLKGAKNELETLKQIQQMLREIDKECELNNDISGLIDSFKLKPITEKLTLVDTDDPWDLFLCGTEVDSCQRVDGDPYLNVGLLAYLLDGKHRLIAIKDETGKIVARRIMRILWDPETKEPVLIMEKPYPKVLSIELQAPLDRFVKKRAKALGLRLYEADDSGSTELQSLGSRIPREYVDSAGGIQLNGVYIVPRATLLKDVG